MRITRALAKKEESRAEARLPTPAVVRFLSGLR